MSVVAVKKYKDKIEIAWDQHINNDFYSYPTTRGWSKAFEFDDIHLFSVGRMDYTLLLRRFFNEKVPTTEVLELSQWYSEFLEDISSKGFDISDSITDRIEHILIHKDRIFWLSDKGLVTEIEDYAAIGSGRYPAEVAMFLGKNPELAVSIAIKLDLFCGGQVKTIKYKF